MLWTCAACTTRYPPDLPRCPHCGSTDYLTGDEPTPEPKPAEAGAL